MRPSAAVTPFSIFRSSQKRITDHGSRITGLGFDDLDPRGTLATVVDDNRRSLPNPAAVDELLARCGAAEQRERGQTEPHIQVALISGAQAPQTPAETG